ncbi:MAG: GNAT family N-acetyltransferase [Halanaerobiaceae bacterium]|jgi:ribosomal protein S18 acetylase RimI-like enzyme|nr:GNAT family N-acetyltransferase [Halanaerobiaceae bacterium]
MSDIDSGKISIGDIEEAHLDSIAEISKLCFSNMYEFDWYENAGNMLKLFRQGRVIVRVIKIGEKAAGFCNLRSWPCGGWIDLIAISPEYQNKGLGSLLLEDIKEKAKSTGYWKISLIVSEREEKVISFYKRNGFIIVGEMLDEIKRGVNGILMSCIVDYELHPNKD